MVDAEYLPPKRRGIGARDPCKGIVAGTDVTASGEGVVHGYGLLGGWPVSTKFNFEKEES